MTEKDPLIFLAFLDEFTEALQLRLEEKTEKYGGTYLERTRKGQTQRIFNRLFRYFWDWLLHRDPINWLDVAGLAFIGWLRNDCPSLSPNWTEEDDWDDEAPETVDPDLFLNPVNALGQQNAA